MKIYCVSYNHEGDEWGLELLAKDSQDAKARMRAIGFNGRIDGELVVRAPTVVGWLVPLVCKLRNWWAV